MVVRPFNKSCLGMNGLANVLSGHFPNHNNMPHFIAEPLINYILVSICFHQTTIKRHTHVEIYPSPQADKHTYTFSLIFHLSK
jgi:hypothetical protein